MFINLQFPMDKRPLLEREIIENDAATLRVLKTQAAENDLYAAVITTSVNDEAARTTTLERLAGCVGVLRGTSGRGSRLFRGPSSEPRVVVEQHYTMGHCALAMCNPSACLSYVSELPRYEFEYSGITYPVIMTESKFDGCACSLPGQPGPPRARCI